MADTRLNIQMSADNAQMNKAFKASTEEIQDNTAALKAQAEQMKASNSIYKNTQKALVEMLHVTEVIPGKIAHLTANLLQNGLVTLELAEGMRRTGGAIVDMKNKLESVKPVMLGLIEETEHYVELLHNDGFVKAAQHAQDFAIRLEGLSGSAHQAWQELDYLYTQSEGKGGGGFSSESVAEAGIVLKEYGQSMQDLLPLSKKLAIGTGRDLATSANTLGAAFSGVTFGLTSLQRTFKITREDIKGAGAALDEDGNIAMRTTGELEKTTKAIKNLIETKYGDALEKNGENLKTAFQSVSNAVEELKEVVGLLYADGVASFVSGIAEMIDKSREFVPVLKYITDNLYSFLTPVTYVAKLGMEALKYLMDTAISVKHAFEGLSDGTKDFVIQLTTGALVATSVAASISGMAFASFKVAAGFGLASVALGKLAGAAQALPVIGAGLNVMSGALGKTALLFGRLGAIAATVLPLVGVAIGLAAGAYMVYQSQAKYAADEQKKFDDQLDRSISQARKYNDELRNSGKSIEESDLTSGKLKIILEGQRAEFEKARIEFEKYADTINGRKVTARGVTIGGASEEEQKELDRLKAIMKEKEDLLNKNNAKLREIIKKRERAQAEEGSSGQALYDKSKALEERNLQFQKDKAAGVIQTKKQEAQEIERLWEESATRMKQIQDEIYVLQDQKANMSESDPMNEEVANRLSKFQNMFNNMQQMENGYRLERLSKNREAVQEELDLAREELGYRTALGKAGNAERLAMLQDFMGKNKAALKFNVALERQVAAEMVQIAFDMRRERQAAMNQTRTDERAALDSKMEDLRYEDSIGKNRSDNAKKEARIISDQIHGQIADIKAKRALDLESISDATLRGEVMKQTEAQIAKLLHDEQVQLRENQAAHAAMTAQEIQDNQARIESAKSVLQAKLSMLEDKFSQGYDNQAEIKANKEAQLQKEIDIIRSEEKAALATEKNTTKIADIKRSAEDKIANLRKNHSLEVEKFDEEVASRVADRQIKIHEIALSEMENRRMEFEQKVLTSNTKGMDIYEEEKKYIQENLNMRLAALKLEEEAELAHRNAPAEKARIRQRYDVEEKKTRMQANKEAMQAAAKESSAKAAMIEKEVNEQKEVLDLKIQQGRAGTSTAMLERQMVADQLEARRRAIEATAKEAILAGDIKDKQRIQRDAQLQINQAIRDAGKALLDVNTKYATGNTALDKIVAKYDKALQDLQMMQGILDGWDDAPAPTPPTEEEKRNDPMAKSKWEDQVKEQQKKVAILKAKKKKQEEEDARKAQAKADAEIEAAQARERTKELRAEGLTGEQIRAKLAEESTARRRAANEAKKNGGGASPNVETDPLKMPPSLREEMGLPDTSSPQGIAREKARKDAEAAKNGGSKAGATEGSKSEGYLAQIAQNTAAMAAKLGVKTDDAGAKKDGKKLDDPNPKGVDGKTISQFSLGDKMKLTPYGYSNSSA